MIGRGSGFRTDAREVRPSAPFQGPFRTPRGFRIRSGFIRRRRRTYRPIRRCRGFYRMSGVFEHRFRRRRARPGEIPLTYRNPAGSFALGVHYFRTVVFGNFRLVAAVREVFRQGRKGFVRGRRNVHSFLNDVTGGFRDVRETGFRKRFHDVGVFGTARAGGFQGF